MELKHRLDERKLVRLRRNFDTACWTYAPPHHVYVGTDIFEPSVIRLGLTDAQRAGYVRSLVFHEFAHGLYTHRDLKYVNQILANMGATFYLWNIFEDAYIEERFRKDNGYRFNWLEALELPGYTDPAAIFISLIKAEGDFELVRRSLKWPEGEAPDDDLLHDVRIFYCRAIIARSSMALMPVIRDWLERFGVPPKAESELETGFRLQVDDHFRVDFEQDLVDSDDEAPQYDAEAKGTSDPQKSTAQVLSPNRRPLNRRRMAPLVERLSRIFRAVERSTNTWVPQKRVKPENLLSGRPPFRRRDLESKRRKRILLVVELSGSMNGGPLEAARLLVGTLNELARAGLVTGHVIFSGVESRKPIYEVHQLPFGDDVPQRMEAVYEGEGLENAIMSNFALAQEADLVLVKTDAQITDVGINKALLHAKGIRTWGLYVGTSEDSRKKLAKYFDNVAMRDSIEDLVETLLTQL